MAGRDWTEVVEEAVRRHVAKLMVPALMVCSFGSAAHADTQTNDGNGLYDLCGGTEAIYTLGICHGYVTGVRDALNGIIICAPSNSTNRQAFDIVIMGLRNHPEERQKPAVTLVVRYLSAAFPCPRVK